MTPSNPDTDRRSEGSMLDEPGNGKTRQKVEKDAQDVKREARHKAETGRHQATGEADALSEAIDAAASNLDEQDREGLARYARQLSNNLSSAASQLEDRSVDDLARDAKHLAQNNPALFMIGSVAVGFGLSRFFKASVESGHQEEGSADRRKHVTQQFDAWTGAPFQRREGDAAQTTSTAPPNGNGRDMP